MGSARQRNQRHRKRYKRRGQLATIFRAIVLEGAGLLIILALFFSIQGDLNQSNRSIEAERPPLLRRAIDFFKSNIAEYSPVAAEIKKPAPKTNPQSDFENDDATSPVAAPVNAVPTKFLRSNAAVRDQRTAQGIWSETRQMH